MTHESITYNLQSEKQKKSKITQAQDSKHKVINRNAERLPEKEQMFIYNEYGNKNKNYGIILRERRFD